jgi:hypothetical protein
VGPARLPAGGQRARIGRANALQPRRVCAPLADACTRHGRTDLIRRSPSHRQSPFDAFPPPFDGSQHPVEVLCRGCTATRAKPEAAHVPARAHALVRAPARARALRRGTYSAGTAGTSGTRERGPHRTGARWGRACVSTPSRLGTARADAAAHTRARARTYARARTQTCVCARHRVHEGSASESARVCVHMCTRASMYIFTRSRVCLFVCLWARAPEHTRACARARARVCVCVCGCVCVRAYV